MVLTSVRITNFKSILDSGVVPIDYDITVLVGQNESGKTAFLQALYQSAPIFGIDKGFDKTVDYPRQNLGKFKALHPDEKAIVTHFTYLIQNGDVQVINTSLGVETIKEGNISIIEDYKGNVTVLGLQELVNEEIYIKHLLKGITLPASIEEEIKSCKSIKALLAILKSKELPEKATLFNISLQGRFTRFHWDNYLALEIYRKYIPSLKPKFFYFDEYRLLPGKTNLKRLQNRITESNDPEGPKPLSSEEQVVLALLQMAEVSLDELLASKGYEEAKANLESVSNRITDQLLKFWLQNPNLEVVLDIAEDPSDDPPYNDGPNIHVRIRNRQQRVTLPLNQRSKGFIWFFSFLVWFDNIHTRAQERGTGDVTMILLLDEPGLNLHALAQANLLTYIDSLAESYQVIYSTHSPFMIYPDRLSQVRVVEDKEDEGTNVSDKLDGSDPKTLFPLQAALGYTIAQNLFISKRNLIVEGISDLTYIKFFSNACEVQGKEGLRPDITIMPVGGIDKIATFVSLLGANKLELVIVHDYDGKPEAKLINLIKERILNEKDLLTYAAYRNPTGKRPTKSEQEAFMSTDIEDLVSIDLYLDLFCETFAQQLNGKKIIKSDLPQGTRIVDRIERYLATNNIKVRPTAGYNHYAPANTLLSTKLVIDSNTIERFAALFKDINKQFPKKKD